MANRGLYPQWRRGSAGQAAILAAALATGAAIMAAAPAIATTTYVETYDTTPTVGGYAAILGSPNGLTYDFYPKRAFSRLSHKIYVLQPGDEGLFWGVNSELPKPAYGLPGPAYSSDTTPGFLFNFYGSGVTPYDMGINFTEGPTVVDSIDFGSANGSNAPAADVIVNGYLGHTQEYSDELDLNPLIATPSAGLKTLNLPATAVDKLTISIVVYSAGLFSFDPSGWYALDNLTYQISGAPTGGYTWMAYKPSAYLASVSNMPEPSAYALITSGVGLIGAGARRRRRGAAPT